MLDEIEKKMCVTVKKVINREKRNWKLSEVKPVKNK